MAYIRPNLTGLIPERVARAFKDIHDRLDLLDKFQSDVNSAKYVTQEQANASYGAQTASNSLRAKGNAPLNLQALQGTPAILTNLPDYANDAAAVAAGLLTGQFYRSGDAVMVVEGGGGGGGGGFTAGGDLSGSAVSQQVIGIQGHLIDGGPTNGDMLVYSSVSGKWEPTTPSAGFTAGGDLSGTAVSQEVIGIQNHLIDGGPTDGDLLVYSSSSGKWEPVPALSVGGVIPLSFDTHPAAPDSHNDEFEAGALDPSWTVLTNTADVVNFSDYAPGSLWVKLIGNHALIISKGFAPGAADFSVTVKFYGYPVAANDFATLYISDTNADLFDSPGTANGFGLNLGFSGGVFVWIYQWNAGVRNFSNLQSLDNGLLTMAYIHAQRVSGVWTFWFSTNGVAFRKFTLGVTIAPTVAYLVLSFNRHGATTPDTHMAVDWMRVNQIFF